MNRDDGPASGDEGPVEPEVPGRSGREGETEATGGRMYQPPVPPDPGDGDRGLRGVLREHPRKLAAGAAVSLVAVVALLLAAPDDDAVPVPEGPPEPTRLSPQEVGYSAKLRPATVLNHRVPDGLWTGTVVAPPDARGLLWWREWEVEVVADDFTDLRLVTDDPSAAALEEGDRIRAGGVIREVVDGVIRLEEATLSPADGAPPDGG